MKAYCKNLAIAADQMVNAVFAGSPDETVSSRLYRLAVLRAQPRRAAVVAYRAVNCLFFWQSDHCKAAWQREKARAHLPDEMK